MWFDKIEKGLYFGIIADKLKLFVTKDADKNVKRLAGQIKKRQDLPVTFLKNVTNEVLSDWERGIRPLKKSEGTQISNTSTTNTNMSTTNSADDSSIGENIKNNLISYTNNEYDSTIFDIQVLETSTIIPNLTAIQKDRILQIFADKKIPCRIYTYKNSTRRGSKNLVSLTKFPIDGFKNEEDKAFQ